MAGEKFQKKYLLSIAASLLVAILIWERTSKEDTNPHKYKEEGDIRVIPRSKRQNYAYKLHDTYVKFYKALQCCKRPLPYLLPEDGLTSCPPADGANSYTNQKPKRNKKKNRKLNNAARTTNWFKQISNSLNAARKSAKNVAGGRLGRQSEAAQKISLKFVCYNDCVFSEAGLFNGSGLDVAEVERVFLESNKNDQYWAPKIQDCLFNCEEPAACATPEAIQVNGIFCSVKSTIMMNCMYKQLMRYCDRKATTECNSAFAQVRKVNVFKLPGN
ncbi:uncharacterized protein LOC132197404 [Neocloeon triangulifer]|uniref:uncharacterized protein LOC132197404 n=1 Tax=Neocloeon triangulifer TaxID=2078957 RepID=UPI00286EDF55|nr:uncharacterized protein LOC132197404 [Neocloeon triangulifer]